MSTITVPWRVVVLATFMIACGAAGASIGWWALLLIPASFAVAHIVNARSEPDR